MRWASNMIRTHNYGNLVSTHFDILKLTHSLSLSLPRRESATAGSIRA